MPGGGSIIWKTENNTMASLKILSFGEILFDCFGDDAHLGGAPLNLAVHLQRLGAEVTLVSAIGRDPLGDRALEIITREKLSADGIARVSQPTGTVSVTLDKDGVANYIFSTDSAYDHIPVPQNLPGEFDLFCFGTLAQRAPESRNTLKTLLAQTRARVFYDVNLRQNFFSPEILSESLRAADLVKLNEDELPAIAEIFALPPTPEAIAEHFHIDTVILTLGPQGCQILHQGETTVSPAFPTQVVSTVGAGDSFSAAFLHSLLTGLPTPTAARNGNRLASQIAAIPSAF